MITLREKQATLLSPTKKDYYQIWNELLETASKLSERWDPTNTNESDPGIVLLKMLTAIADKLNYNIDKNTLEAFMPSASQELSMRKLCLMMGYNMKYYQSATTRVTIAYLGLWENEDEDNASTNLPTTSFVIPRHTNITDKDKSINYFTLTDLNISKTNEVGTVEVMQGQLVECEPDNNYLITLANLDDNNRYYLPLTQIALNGIFVEGGTVFENAVVSEWTQVDNLYARLPNSKVFKFGYDSKRRLPYIQFPETIAELIGTGLKISYVRTAGIYGNISANTLTAISANKLTGEGWEVAIDDTTFNVFNANAATNGADKESIDQAYNSYKKTVGTFDTLVTCRDYMNAIYNLTQSAVDTSPLLSNVNVTDIRDDINKALTICSFDSLGIIYNEVACIDKATEKDLINAFDLVIYPFKTIYNNSIIDYTRYDKSFQLDTSSATQASIRNGISDNKTIAHKINYPSTKDDEDVIAIKNYYQLNAQITTVRKVNIILETDILTNIHQALYKAFNMRNLDFGELIPFDAILDVIKNADERIRNVSLQEPTVLTSFLCANGLLYDNVSSGRDSDLTDDVLPYNRIYNKLALRNILAGRIALFNYNTNFVAKWDEAPCETFTATATEPTDKNFAAVTQLVDGEIKTIYKLPNAALSQVQDGSSGGGGTGTGTGSNNGLKLDSILGKLLVSLTNHSLAKPITLGKNEAIQFSTINYKTTKTYPAYVNYYLYLNSDLTSKDPEPATFMTLGAFLEAITLTTISTVDLYPAGEGTSDSISARKLKNGQTVTFNNADYELSIVDLPSDDVVKNSILYIPCGNVGTEQDPEYEFTYDTFYGHQGTGCPCNSKSSTAKNLAYRPSDWGTGLRAFYKLITSLILRPIKDDGTTDTSTTISLQGIFRRLSSNLSRDPGYCVDQNLYKYMPANSAISTVDPFYGKDGTVDCYWVQNPAEGSKNQYGLGVNGTPAALAKDTLYLLKENEMLFINYTPSGTDEEGNQVTKSPVYLIYGLGTVIKPNFNVLKSNVSSPSKPAFSKLLGESVSNAFSSAARINGVPDTLPYIADTGLYSFGAQLQIEIRLPMIISIGNSSAAGNYNFYWLLLNTDTLTLLYLDLYTYDEDTKSYVPVPATDTDFTSRIVFAKYHRFMKSGEYFFFTDKYKTQMAYYGDGSLISYYLKVTARPTPTPKPKTWTVNDEGPSVETILEEGIRAVPWLSIALDINKYFTVTEYKYITLAEDDTLLSLTTEDDELTVLPSILNPVKVDDTAPPTYSFKDGEGAIESLPKTPNGWYVGTRLSILAGPNTAMTLRSTENCIDKVIFTYKNGNTTTEVALQTGIEADTPLSLKLNSAVSSPTGSITISPDSTFEPKAIAFEQKQLVAKKTWTIEEEGKDPVTNEATAEVLVEGNKLDHWTLFILSPVETVDNIRYTSIVNLYANIPVGNFGLVAIYVDKTLTHTSTNTTTPEEEAVQPATIALSNIDNLTLSVDSSTAAPATLNEFLSDTTSPSLSLDTPGKLYIIKISADTTLTLTNNTNAPKTIIISPLDIINKTNTYGFDVDTIDYRKVTLDTPADLLFKDLQNMFFGLNALYADQYPYLNGPIESDLAININTSANPPEKLSDARIWYDYNNVNNNFVISQIDTSYLYNKSTSTYNGIVLTRSSKL